MFKSLNQEGTFTVEVDEIEISVEKDKKTGRPKEVMTWRLRVVEGEHAQKQFTKQFHLVNESVFRALRRECGNIDVEIENKADFLKKKGLFIGMKIVVEVSTNDYGFEAVRFLRRAASTPATPEISDGDETLMLEW